MKKTDVKFDQIQPILHRVLIKPDPVKEKHDNGLIIPVNMRKEATSGIILKCGKGTKSLPMRYKVGDRVIFPRAVSRENQWEIEGKIYLFCIQQDIIVKLKNNDV